MVTIIPDDALRLGLGCSRLGSVNGSTGDEARALLRAALDEGVRFFDTSNIYAQGDSERYLGEVLGDRTDCVICSKGGKYLSLTKRALVPFKGMLRKVARRSGSAREGVARIRSNPMPTRWDGPFLTSSLEQSLRRLRRERLDIYMLHSPSAEVLKAGEAMQALEKARDAGKTRWIGASVDDPDAMMAALADPRVEVLQVPLHPGDASFDAAMLRAAEQGIAIVAREVLGGPKVISGSVSVAAFAAERIPEMVARSDVAVTLVGTTKTEHLRAAAGYAR
ncbi:aldo/keto reductase [Martelella lutilitoris]|uniref:Aldo/keto reductase n=1 Tax=Martelella lutilitoris TaxID=2583532 RepID=A0A7T7KN39_9HYPH|nr:aldo/keto reductase [Martelella lutilitoris]QQM32466.1 aldo/keto reductase [Martelella lutilitoris]